MCVQNAPCSAAARHQPDDPSPRQTMPKAAEVAEFRRKSQLSQGSEPLGGAANRSLVAKEGLPRGPAAAAAAAESCGGGRGLQRGPAGAERL